LIRSYELVPVAKPRMTQRDRWYKRPATKKYWDFKERVQGFRIDVPESGSHILFILPMPASWSKKKKAAMYGTPHQQKPDKDNLEKALLDAIFDDDAHVWDSRVSKLWGYTGMIVIEEDCEIPFSISNMLS